MRHLRLLETLTYSQKKTLLPYIHINIIQLQAIV